ncbi:MAG: response regulator, partial [Angelakisella sp.]|nr:response regulator [Angelakisella sp.]
MIEHVSTDDLGKSQIGDQYFLNPLIALYDDRILFFFRFDLLQQLINLYRTSRHLNCEHAAFSNGFELISALEKGKRFDIYCLDIMMPGFTGIDVAKEIRGFDKTAPILFFTSSPEFAL